MSEVETTAQAAAEICAIGSYILSECGRIAYISAKSEVLLQQAAVNGDSLVFQLLSDTKGTPLLKEITAEASGREV